jgi:hypothetical protein
MSKSPMRLRTEFKVENSKGLTWEEWLRASGPCSVMSGRESKRKDALKAILRKAWMNGEDPKEYRA